ncbi:hypothetical protein [Shewanella sp. Isolate11]|uniref:hypothetical protein n=1 Tax=Shewanella sp. Isolate11 TaxID=2908530 RepID=UPI001EFE19B0|nr:hypothetical protein [Shewanella sp. Isolate11]MCG9695917.1 hypothetical protein [Shewanella sp. Isolate11]
MGANIANKWFAGEIVGLKLDGLLENKLRSFFVGRASFMALYSLVATLAFISLNCLQQVFLCKHAFGSLQVHPWMLCEIIHDFEGQKRVYTELSISSI